MASVLPQLVKLRGTALNLIFPQFCVGCGREGAYICDSCSNSLTRLEPPLCPLCGRPQENVILCYTCRNWQAAIDAIRSPFRFEGVIRSAVHQLKYNNLRAITVELARLLFEYLKINPMDGDILIPVPLYHKRLKERGYNQSALLALELGKLASIPVDSAGMVRERYAVAQARTRNVEERRRNVAGVFQYHGEGVRGKNVIIIDDVSTSGATMNACAAALKAAGAVSVWGLALAREI